MGDLPHLDDRPVVAVFRTPAFNASEGFVQAQAASLVRYQPLIVALEDKGNAIPALRDRMILPASAAERERLRLFGLGGVFVERVRAAHPVLVHAHFGPDGLRALPLARALDVPLVTSLRGYDVSRRDSALLASGRLAAMRYALAKGRLMAEGALFLTVSDSLRRMAIGRGFDPGRTITHYNGVDLARFCAGGPRGGALILFVGRLVQKKGAGLLIEAFAAVRRTASQARLVIAGDGPLRAALQARVRALGLGDAVSFAGALPQDDIADLMRRATVLAAPSQTAPDGDAEGLPNVVVEAAASSLPVVATPHSGIPEAVIDGETGFLVPEGDTGALAARLSALLGAEDLGRAMGDAARRLAEQRFDHRRQAERLETLYDQLWSGRGCA